MKQIVLNFVGAIFGVLVGNAIIYYCERRRTKRTIKTLGLWVKAIKENDSCKL